MTDSEIPPRIECQAFRTPAWKSYVRFFLWTIPFLLTYYFCFLFIFPKVYALIDASTDSIPPSDFMLFIAGCTQLVISYFWIVAPAIVVFIILPEILPFYRRFRGLHLAVISYFACYSVLLTITIVAITVCLVSGISAEGSG